MLYKMVQTCDSVLISVDGCEVSVPYQTKEQYFFTMHATRGSVDILLWINYPNTTIVMKFMEYYFSLTIFIGLLKVRPSSVDKTSNVTIRKAVIRDYFLKISFCTRKLLRSVDTNIIVFKDQNHVVFLT